MIVLADAQEDDFTAFKSELQAAFAVAVVDEFGALPMGRSRRTRSLTVP